MNDVLDIGNLKARYCAAADLAATDPAAARAEFASIFSDDFTGDYAMEPLVGARAVTDFLCTAIAGSSEWMIHMLSSPRISVSGDSATGDWTVLVHSKRRETGARTAVIGRYSDRFLRTPSGWRIARVQFLRPD